MPPRSASKICSATLFATLLAGCGGRQCGKDEVAVTMEIDSHFTVLQITPSESRGVPDDYLLFYEGTASNLSTQPTRFVLYQDETGLGSQVPPPLGLDAVAPELDDAVIVGDVVIPGRDDDVTFSYLVPELSGSSGSLFAFDELDANLIVLTSADPDIDVTLDFEENRYHDAGACPAPADYDVQGL